MFKECQAKCDLSFDIHEDFDQTVFSKQSGSSSHQNEKRNLEYVYCVTG